MIFGERIELKVAIQHEYVSVNARLHYRFRPAKHHGSRLYPAKQRVIWFGATDGGFYTIFCINRGTYQGRFLL